MTLDPLSIVEYQDYILFLIRLLVGVIFLYFGIPKIRDLGTNAENFEKMGFKPGILWGTLIALLETVGSVALILGLFPYLTAFLFAGHMLTGTIWKSTSTDKPFSDYSYDLLILTLMLTILAFGPGAYSLM